MKMYITVAPRYNKLLYNEVLGIRNYFLTPVMVKYGNMKQNLDIS